MPQLAMEKFIFVNHASEQSEGDDRLTAVAAKRYPKRENTSGGALS